MWSCFCVPSLIVSYSFHIAKVLRDPMAASEDVWEGRTAGVKLMRESLLLRLSEVENVGQLLEEKKGMYSKKLKGWLLDYRNLKISVCNPSGSWLNVNVEGEFAVFKPVRGLQISTTFMNLEDGQARCGVMVSVTNELQTRRYCQAFSPRVNSIL